MEEIKEESYMSMYAQASIVGIVSVAIFYALIQMIDYIIYL